MSRALPGWEGLGRQPRTVFQRTPLVLALCQIRFPKKLSINNPSVVAGFQDAIQEEYPEADERQNQTAQIQVSDGEVGIQQSVAQSVSWHFADGNGDWAVVLGQDFVTLETRSYRHFDEFLARLDRILSALDKTVRPSRCRRVGLRYINEIRPGHTQWQRAIHTDLLGPLAEPPFSNNATRAVQLITMDAGDAQIHLQHGVIPTGTTVQPRSGQTSGEDAFYLFDMDVFREFRATGAMTMEPGPICTLVARFHETISEAFRWAVTEEYTATLGERSDAER